MMFLLSFHSRDQSRKCSRVPIKTSHAFQIGVREVRQGVPLGQDAGPEAVVEVVPKDRRRSGDRLWTGHDARAIQVNNQAFVAII